MRRTDHDGLHIAGEVEPGAVVGDEFGTEPLGLLAQDAMSSGPVIPSGKPGKFSTSVVVISAPPYGALDDERAQTGPGGVQRGGVPGRPARR